MKFSRLVLTATTTLLLSMTTRALDAAGEELDGANMLDN